MEREREPAELLLVMNVKNLTIYLEHGIWPTVLMSRMRLGLNFYVDLRMH